MLSTELGPYRLNIPICLKGKIMDTVLLQVMTYAAETWILTEHQEKLAVAQRICC